MALQSGFIIKVLCGVPPVVDFAQFFSTIVWKKLTELGSTLNDSVNAHWNIFLSFDLIIIDYTWFSLSDYQ